MNKKILGSIILLSGISIFAYILYQNSQKKNVPVIFAPKEILSGTWAEYKDIYIEKNTFRALDKQQGNITTSEGQSYCMLRAVWEDDQTMFNNCYEWAKRNLQRDSDRLFSWLFGEQPDGSFAVLISRGGQNSASDADIDIAFSLLMAASRWNQDEYKIEAEQIIQDIWNEEVIVVNGTPYVAANNIEKNSTDQFLVNPSYLSPAAFRAFAKADPSHNWEAVVESSLNIIQASTNSSLGQSSGKLPPDWVYVNRQTGELSPVNQNGLTTNYSFDAMRTPWRLALDYAWHGDERTKRALESFSHLASTWNERKTLFTVYGHDGEPKSHFETPAIYGGSIGYFVVTNPELAEEIYDNKLRSLYNPDTQGWKQTLSYYDDNWAWFGIALYNNMLPNLIE